MRTRIVTAIAAGSIGLAGFALAAPTALGAAGAPDAATAVQSRVDRVKQALSGLVGDGTITQAQADKVASTLGSADLGGGPGGRGGRGGMDLSVAATALGMTEEEVHTALHGGKTLAALAREKDVPVATLVTKLVDAAKARIAADVTAGRLTQAQADEKLADLQDRITERVNSTRPAGGPGRGGDRPGAPTATATPTPSS